MKIGIVSDVHCNHAGLLRALEILGDVDELICLGDSIYEYRFSNEVVRLLKDRAAHTILGNHEEGFLGPQGVRARQPDWIDRSLLQWLVEQPKRLELDIDGGALGIVMPHVDTAEEAREIADRLRYPPQGHRSVAGGLPHLGYVPIAIGAACAAINATTLVVVMLETPKAIPNAAAIAAVPGIDSLLIGTSDLTMELGIPGQLGDERIVDAYRTVIEACRANGKYAGIGGVYEETLMCRYIGMGVRLVLGGGDLGFMTTAATERAKMLRTMR